MDFNFYSWCDHNREPKIKDSKKLDIIIELLQTIIKKENTMSLELDRLTTEVAEVNTVQQSAIDLLKGLSAQIEALKLDPVALQALSDSLDASSNALAQAVVANTPAAAPPVV